MFGLCSFASTWEFWWTPLCVFVKASNQFLLCLFQTFFFFAYKKTIAVLSIVFLCEETTKQFGREFAAANGKEHKLCCWMEPCPRSVTHVGTAGPRPRSGVVSQPVFFICEFTSQDFYLKKVSFVAQPLWFVLCFGWGEAGGMGRVFVVRVWEQCYAAMVCILKFTSFP